MNQHRASKPSGDSRSSRPPSDVTVQADTGDADQRMAHILGAFSRGEISRQHAMRELGLSYGDLLEHIAERNLRLPRVPDEDSRRMAEIVSGLLTTGRR